MIKFLKKLFKINIPIINPKREYSLWEKMHLNRLEKNEVHTEHKGRKYYIYDNSGLDTDEDLKLEYVEILGYYRYYDVDGTVAGLVAKNINSGEILNVIRHLLFVRKPHDWLLHLEFDKINEYNRLQKYISDDKLYEQFFKTLPRNVIRDIKLKKLNI